ncbi:PIR protein [Plasmodium vivax]|uniref:VIR protein n=1 Tax=Plasmodium vivax TaxID=5855 RepID=A0A565A6M5_PLAVI|nr:PIR protein [Plasmodium vivax]
MSGNKPDYSFFNHFESCYKVECEKDKPSFFTDYANYCKDANFPYNEGNQVEVIFLDMVKLYNNAILGRIVTPVLFKQNKIPEFINFWINNRLTQSGFSDDIKAQICPKLDSITRNFDEQQLLINKIYHIKEKEVDGMNILYEFYKNIYVSAQKENDYFQKFIENFKKNYNDGLFKCFHEGDVKFCNELYKYSIFYEEHKKDKLSKICEKKECPSLTELKLLLSDPKNEHLNIAKMGLNLIGGSQLSSLNELPSLETDDNSNLKILFSLQYNLPMEENEDKKNCAMLNILYKYLKYCNEHNNNWNLEPFIYEFMEKYYNKNKSHYKNLFENCTSEDKESKQYCTYYDKCKSDFKEDFTLIETSKEAYIKNKEEYFKNLNSKKSWVQRALDLFKDFDTILRNSPIITSTLIAIFLCLFFLYKLTTLSSIFRKEKKKRKIPLFYPQRIIQDVKVDNSGYINPKTKRGKIRFAYQPS